MKKALYACANQRVNSCELSKPYFLAVAVCDSLTPACNTGNALRILSVFADSCLRHFPVQPVRQQFSVVSAWVQDQSYEPVARDIFFQAPDYWLIAYALSHNCTVVTHEVPGNRSTKKVKIPDVCVGLGIPCITQHIKCYEEKTRVLFWAPAQRQYLLLELSNNPSSCRWH